MRSQEHYCAYDTIRITFVDDSGIKENEDDLISIYPNPSNGDVNIYFRNEFRGSAVEIKVQDLNGRSMFTINTEVPCDGRINLPLSLHGNNIYFIRIVTKNMSLVRKIVVI
jgi:hypothetical protein